MKAFYRVTAYCKVTGDIIFYEDFDTMSGECADNIKMNLQETNYAIHLTRIEPMNNHAFATTDQRHAVKTDSNGFCHMLV